MNFYFSFEKIKSVHSAKVELTENRTEVKPENGGNKQKRAEELTAYIKVKRGKNQILKYCIKVIFIIQTLSPF